LFKRAASFTSEAEGCSVYGCSYPMQKRLQVIVTYLITLSIAKTSRTCLVSYNCVEKYVRLFQHRATLSPNARPKKIPWWMEAYLEALVRIYPSLLYLRELQHLLANDFNLAPGDVPSVSAITNLFLQISALHERNAWLLHLNECPVMFFTAADYFSSGEEPLTLA